MSDEICDPLSDEQIDADLKAAGIDMNAANDRLKYLVGYHRLKRAIEKHRAQKADDRCWMDDDQLYAALGDGIKCDRRVGDKAAMMVNCARFIERRCETGGPWVSYAELEAKVASLEAEAAREAALQRAESQAIAALEAKCSLLQAVAEAAEAWHLAPDHKRRVRYESLVTALRAAGRAAIMGDGE